MTEEKPCIIVRDLNHFFGEGESRKQVLFENNLRITPGELVIMTGPSGSGKTTLLTLIGALRSCQEGGIELLNKEISALSSRELVEVRRDIGFIFQMHNLFESLTAYQNVTMALDLTKESSANKRAMAESILKALGLGDRIHYKPCALSGGQRQRVAVARALVNRPKLILADEPTAALDKDASRTVVKLLRQLADENKSSIMMVTHDNRILDAADRIINMVDGAIISNVRVEESLNICKFLQNCDVFSEMAPAVLSYVAEKLVKESYQKGSKIIRQGSEGDKFYLIGDGVIDVLVDDGQVEKVVTTLSTGDFFGEAALLTNQSRNATCIAKTNCKVYSLDKSNFTATVESSQTFKEQLRNILFQRQ
jgi:putative ABC transport system ATP-binding protein